MPRWLIACAGLTALWSLAGCASKPPQIKLTTYDENGCPDCARAFFSRASYRAVPGGLLEIAMETEGPSSVDPTQKIRQIIYLKTFWYPQPGRTFVESSQIDSRMMYAVLTPPTGIRCDGSAMLTYKWNKKGKQIELHIESGSLVPKYRMGNTVEPFLASRFVGEGIAYENPGEVVNTVQYLETQFRETLPTLQSFLEISPTSEQQMSPASGLLQLADTKP